MVAGGGASSEAGGTYGPGATGGELCRAVGGR